MPRMVRRTRNDNVPIMCNEVLEDLLWAVHNIHISPVNPGMFWLQCRREQIISSSSHVFPSWRLCCVSMAVIHGLGGDNPEILFHDQNTVERLAQCVGRLLYSCQFGGKDGKSIIRRVPNQKCEVNEMVRICQFREEVEVFW